MLQTPVLAGWQNGTQTVMPIGISLSLWHMESYSQDQSIFQHYHWVTQVTPYHENLSPNDWDFWPSGWQAFPSAQQKIGKNTWNRGSISKIFCTIGRKILKTGTRFQEFLAIICCAFTETAIKMYFRNFDLVTLSRLDYLRMGKASMWLMAFTQPFLLNFMQVRLCHPVKIFKSCSGHYPSSRRHLAGTKLHCSEIEEVFMCEQLAQRVVNYQKQINQLQSTWKSTILLSVS